MRRRGRRISVSSRWGWGPSASEQSQRRRPGGGEGDAAEAVAARGVAPPPRENAAGSPAVAAIDAVERIVSGSHTAALALVRPPGHHAERNRAMGFCLYNNVAVAAAHARSLGIGRVAIVDYDVHHGNGTQHVFECDPTVLYISTHQYPYYPGTGAADEIGTAGGAGFTVNLPLEAGATGDDFRLVFDRVI